MGAAASPMKRVTRLLYKKRGLVRLATKSEVQKRRVALKQFVSQAIAKGDLQSGQILPPVRELAVKYQLSSSVVNQAMQDLAEEGLLYLVPRVGTFVGQPSRHASEFFLLIMPTDFTRDFNEDEQISRIEQESRETLNRLQRGFEERITQLGGTNLVTTAQHALELRGRAEMPPLAGVFNYDYQQIRVDNWHADGIIPHVGFTSWAEDREHYDLVSFDDIGGGRHATQCLIDMGHRKIAYLALHARDAEPGIALWSLEREAGWRETMIGSGLSPEGLAFHPDIKMLVEHDSHQNSQYNAGLLAAQALIYRPEISAVVAANDAAAFGLIMALKAAGLPGERWPAIVGFDNANVVSQYLVTSLSLPWGEIGRAAADLLWQRRHGKLTGLPVHRRVPMRLIRRISSQTGWSIIAPAITVDMMEAGASVNVQT